MEDMACFNTFEMGKEAEAEGRWESAVTFFDEAGECFLRKRDLLFAFKSFLCSANAYRKLGIPEGENRSTKKALFLGEELFAQNRIDFSQLGEAQFARALALSSDQKQPQEALKFAERALSLWKEKRKASEVAEPPWLSDLTALIESLKTSKTY